MDLSTSVVAAGVLILAAWWVVSGIILPGRSLLAVLRRIADGDFRPVILPGLPPYLRKAETGLRKIAETLASQRDLLAKEEFSLSMILGSMTEGVVILGPDLRIRQLNNAALSMFNLTGNVSGLLLPEVFTSHELQGLASRASRNGELECGELALTIAGRSDRCHLAITAAPLKAGPEDAMDGVLLVLHDVTRLRELEAVRREFVANVSHEFRTPLSVINGYLETLGEGGVGREMTRKAIAAMQRHTGRLNRLIEDLLSISRMEEKGVRLETSRTDVAQLLRAVIEQAEHEITERKATVTLSLAEGLPHAQLDAYRIEQAFSNLLTNALRHGTPSGESEGAMVTVSAFTSGHDIAISFRDNGPGIPLADQDHIFERFYRVGGDRARQSGGTGLGLSIVKNVVLAHAGRVALKSSPGEGSTFIVYLPAA
jgi:two-component system, OmpR family, phosphate regulon sensor histidine kinase PhoR